MRNDAGMTTVEPTGKAVVSDLTPAERADVYRWLSGLFAREPAPESLLFYRSAEGEALLEGLGGIEALEPVVLAIRARISRATEPDLAPIALEIAGEFARLFLGVGGRYSAPPYQSFYVNADGRLMQHTAAEMQEELRHLDVRLGDGFFDLPDHIAVQLAVMAELTQTADIAKQAEYLEHRLLGWIGKFRDRCVAANRAGFYAAAAGAVVDFVHADVVLLRG